MADGFKYVPAFCYAGQVPQRFHQYTMIDEASRERFLFHYMEQSSYSTVDFVKRAIEYFGCKPQIIQTDNGSEFTHSAKTAGYILWMSSVESWTLPFRKT